MQEVSEGDACIDSILQSIMCCLRNLSSRSVRVQQCKEEPGLEVRKHKRKERSNELNMCLNFAVGMHSFSLAFLSRKTHMVSSNWHKEWFTSGSDLVILVVHMIICHTDVSACIYSLAASHAASSAPIPA